MSLFLLYLVEMICSGLQIIYNTDEVKTTTKSNSLFIISDAVFTAGHSCQCGADPASAGFRAAEPAVVMSTHHRCRQPTTRTTPRKRSRLLISVVFVCLFARLFVLFLFLCFSFVYVYFRLCYFCDVTVFMSVLFVFCLVSCPFLFCLFGSFFFSCPLLFIRFPFMSILCVCVFFPCLMFL